MLMLIALILCAPAAFAFSIHLIPAADFATTPAEELHTKLKVSGLIVEDFEDDQRVEGFRTTLSQSISPDPAPNAWDGKTGSAEVNSALFEFDVSGVRVFGIGLGDNDGGSETLSINGGWHINLNSFPNHSSNGQGKAYYLVVIADENDPDLRAISIANGFTIAFDHLVFGTTPRTPPPTVQFQQRPQVSFGPGVGRVRGMAERIQQQQRGDQPGAVSRAKGREGELIANGNFDQVDFRNGDDPSGIFGEAMFAPGSKRLLSWTVRDAVVSLRDRPSSPAGGPILELGPRDEPGSIAQRIKTEPGKNYELTFLAAGGRNHQIKVSVEGEERIIECPDPSAFKRVNFPFRANAAETEVIISGVGREGFGPMIDDVSVLPVKGE